MRVLGIAVMKNEADIVRPFLEHSRAWCDRIFVYDNGSTDATWQIVQDMADDVIVAWKTEDVPFHNNLRARVFNEFRHEATPGDWWCYRLDADEFYIDDPREFLVAVPDQYHTVYRKAINFRVAMEDAEQYPFTGEFASDREFIHYFLPKGSVERRFIRHRQNLVWTEDDGTSYTGITYPKMVLARHYQWRSPQQIQKRLESKRSYLLRKEEKKGRAERRARVDRLYSPENWRELCPSRNQMILDTGPDSWTKIQWPDGKIKRVHETGFSYFAKRLLHALRLVR